MVAATATANSTAATLTNVPESVGRTSGLGNMASRQRRWVGHRERNAALARHAARPRDARSGAARAVATVWPRRRSAESAGSTAAAPPRGKTAEEKLVDPTWGKRSTPQKDHEDGNGIAKLVAKGRAAILDRLPEIFPKMKVDEKMLRANSPDSAQQLVDDRFDVNHGCVEELDPRSWRVAQ
jgi:hypothetical protein